MTGWITQGCLCLVAIALLAGCGGTPPPAAPLPRPVNTMVIGSEAVVTTRSIPGRVLAGRRVQLAFDVSGTVIELNAREGLFVKEGDIIAKLDQRDFINAVDSARAERDRAKAQFERVRIAADLNAVSQQELSDARATMEMAEAQLRIRKKSLEDSVLRARFSGHIANRHIDNFTSVQAKQPIVSLQDITDVEIEVFVPEVDLIAADPRAVKERRIESELFAVFDTLPGVKFPVTIKEFATEADPLTQTFRAVLIMPSPTNFTVLPGMTANIRRQLRQTEQSDTAFFVPVRAVGVDAVTGGHFVLMIDNGTGVGKVMRRVVETGEIIEGNILIRSGLNRGDRIALAGISLLQEGTVVRPR